MSTSNGPFPSPFRKNCPSISFQTSNCRLWRLCAFIYIFKMLSLCQKVRKLVLTLTPCFSRKDSCFWRPIFFIISSARTREIKYMSVHSPLWVKWPTNWYLIFRYKCLSVEKLKARSEALRQKSKFDLFLTLLSFLSNSIFWKLIFFKFTLSWFQKLIVLFFLSLFTNSFRFTVLAWGWWWVKIDRKCDLWMASAS